MASNLACVGLSVADTDELSSLLTAIRPRAAVFGRVGNLELLRWEDEGSGARIVLGIEHGEVVDLLPSLASRPATRLADIRAANPEVATASVLDDDGEQVTALAVELEQRRLLGARVVEHGDAAIVGLGRTVTVHVDADAFAASPASLLDPAKADSEPPPHFAERGLTWPPRLAGESFISYGVFGEPAEAKAGARLAGRVLASERRTTTATDQAFIVARVRTAGFEIDLCLSGAEHPAAPEPGCIVAGEVYLVGSMPSLEQPGAPKRWWRGRSR